jgi:spore photoproduct lyase
VVEDNERDTPPLKRRIRSIKETIKKGWWIRPCFDPVLVYDGWELDYADLIQTVRSELNSNAIHDIIVGVFRMGQDYFQHIRKFKPESEVFYQNYEKDRSNLTLSKPQRDLVHRFMDDQLVDYIPSDRIYYWE